VLKLQPWSNERIGQPDRMMATYNPLVVRVTAKALKEPPVTLEQANHHRLGRAAIVCFSIFDSGISH
jgi:hypothetical protein